MASPYSYPFRGRDRNRDRNRSRACPRRIHVSEGHSYPFDPDSDPDSDPDHEESWMYILGSDWASMRFTLPSLLPGCDHETASFSDRRLFVFPSHLAAAPLFPQQVRYGTGSWDAETLGNHRVVLRVTEKADAVWAHIPWRRRDLEPEKKKIIVRDEAGKKVTNLLRIEINRSYEETSCFKR